MTLGFEQMPHQDESKTPYAVVDEIAIAISGNENTRGLPPDRLEGPRQKLLQAEGALREVVKSSMGSVEEAIWNLESLSDEERDSLLDLVYEVRHPRRNLERLLQSTDPQQIEKEIVNFGKALAQGIITLQRAGVLHSLESPKIAASLRDLLRIETLNQQINRMDSRLPDNEDSFNHINQYRAAGVALSKEWDNIVYGRA